MRLAKLSETLTVKLASLVVHCQEARSPKAHHFDFAAIGSLVDDPEVKGMSADAKANRMQQAMQASA